MRLRTITLDCQNHCIDSKLLSVDRITIFLLSILNTTASCEDLSSHISLGVPAVVAALRKLLSYKAKVPITTVNQVIFDGGRDRHKGTPGADGHFVAASLSGSEAAALMKVYSIVKRTN